MTTSPYLPDVKVEVAFNAGYGTAAAGRVWTDVSPAVELHAGIKITVGRDGERTQAGANRLELTLDNSDGRFTPNRAASPYYPNVRIGRPIRVTATPPGGSPSTRFLGFVDQWPIEWDGTAATSSAKIIAYSRLARLGIGHELTRLPTVAARALNPLFVWPLQEVVNGAVVDVVAGVPLYQGFPTTAPSVGERGFLTGLTITSGESGVQGVSSGPVCTAVSMAFTFKASRSPGPSYAELVWTGNTLHLADGADAWRSTWYGDQAGAGLLTAYSPTGRYVATTACNDLAPHHIVATEAAGGPLRLWVDGVMVDETYDIPDPLNGPTLIPTPLSVVEIGAAWANADPWADDELVLADVAIFGYALNGGQIADLYAATAATLGFEPVADRLERYLGQFTAIAADTISIDADATGLIGPIKTDGRNLLEVLREAEVTDAGVLLDRPDGTLAYVARGSRYNMAPAITLDTTAGEVGADLSPKYVRSQIVNTATYTDIHGRAFTAIDQASVDEYGPTNETATIAAAGLDAEALSDAIVARYAQPRPRYEAVTVKLDEQSASRQGQLFALNPAATLIRVTNLPAQAAASTARLVVEGWTEAVGPADHRMTFNLSPGDLPGMDVWVVGDATYGDPTEYGPAL